ncbi:response regulator transcription factor [Spongiibacter taiwanensis]|uniref:response regulator transcription factor n=1 Tax=Spongiibacter taiwanensis TaxID=1748242 RepID=UPI0020358B01|nr:response regulator transcription factor [Spongiibacter taiwanensis]USA42672.1 response regulator transcription factor [Spongiibacter taiwanensis]
MPTSKANTHILIIEDDVSLSEQLGDRLREHTYEVSQCYDGESGLSEAIRAQHQLILLDVMLPKRDGYSVLNILRKTCNTPVIMLTARGAEEERIRGFTEGADDYLAKPFSTTELLLRIEALLRRCQPSPSFSEPRLLGLDNLQLDKQRQRVAINNIELELTPIQFKLLWTLLAQRGEVLSKAYLYQTVLNRTFSAYDRSLDMHLSRVRRKLTEAGWRGERLETVHGKGYLLS